MGRVERRPAGWRFSAVEVVAGPSELFGCSFAVDVDDGWLTCGAVVRVVAGGGERELSLTVDDGRRWLVDGVHRPDLDGCLDVDVAATPLTNTFPIRRLAHLTVGEEATTPVAWVDVPTLTVTRVEQGYRRLPDVDGLAAWAYRDDAHGRFELRVDEEGVVVEYEAFARRVVATPWRRHGAERMP